MVRALLAFAQLSTIIVVAYFLHRLNLFHSYFETYTPHVLFSSFLFGLQGTMVSNFRVIL